MLIAVHRIVGIKLILVKWEMNRLDLGTTFINAISILYRLSCLKWHSTEEVNFRLW